MATKKKIPKNVSNLVYNMKDLIDKIKSRQLSQIFTNPVDEKLDYAPNYYNVIKKPMCLNDMMAKLKDKVYTRPIEVLDDFKLIVSNCRDYNTDLTNSIHKKADAFLQCFEKQWKENAANLAQYGVDINTAYLDYTGVDTSDFGAKKLTKEQRALMSDPMVNMEPVSRKKNQTSFVDPLDMDNMPLATFDRYSSMPPEKTKSTSDTKIKLNIRDFSNAAERENPYPPQQEKYYDTPSLSNSQSVNFQYNNYDNQKYNPNNNQMFEPKSKAVANIFGKPPAQLDHFMPNEPKLPSLQKSNSSNSSTIKIYNTDMMNKQGPRPPNTLPQQQQPSMSQSYNPPDSYNSYNTQNTFSTGNTQNNFSTTHNDPYAQSQPQRSMQQHQSLNQTPQQNPSLQRNISAPAFPQQKMTSNPVPQNQHQMNYNKPPTMYPQSYGPSIQPEKIQQPSYTQNNYPQPTMSFHDDAGFGNFHESPPNYSSNSNYIQPHQSYIKQDIQPQPQHQHQHQPQQQSQPQLQTQSQPQSQPYQSQVYPPQNNYNHNNNGNNYNTSSNYNSSFTLPIQDYDKPEHQFHDKFMDLKTDPVMKSPEKVFSPPQEMMKEEEPLNFILEKKPNEKPVIKVEKPKPQFSTPPPVKNDIPKTPDVVFERPSKDLGKSPNPFKISINKTVFDETSKPTHNPIVETKTKEPSQVFEKPNVIKIKNPSSVESSKDTQIKISFGSSKTPVIVPPTITPTISISEPTPVTISTPKFYPEPEKEPPPTIKPLPQAEDKDLKITVIQKEKVPEELPKPQIITAQKSTENENISNLEIPSLMPTNSEISVPDLEQTVSVTSDMMLDDPFEPYDSKIKFNVQEMQEKFKQNLVTKVPKYIFKFKKCVRNLDSAFLRWDIREEKIIAMRNDIFNSLFGEKPFVYSRALLFLFITTTYIKYAFEVQKLEKKGFKEIFKITQKAYNYLKSIIDISYISFSPQDTDGFDRERRDFRSKHKEQKKERIIPMMPPEDDTLAIFDSDPGKKFKSTKESTKIQLNSKLLGQGKKLFKPEKDETKEDVIRRQVQELIRRVRDFNEDPNRIEMMQQKVTESWKFIEPADNNQERPSAVSRNRSEMISEDNKQKEDDNIYPASSSVGSINFSLKKKAPSSSFFKRRAPEFLYEEERYANLFRWDPNPDLFKQVPANMLSATFMPGIEFIDGEFTFPLKSPVFPNQPIEIIELQITYFETVVSDELKKEFSEKKYKMNPTPNQQTDNKMLNHIVILRVKLRQSKEYMDRQVSNNMTFRIKNQLPGEMLYKFRELMDNKIHLDMKIVDYNVLMKASELKRAFEEKTFDNQITTYIQKNNMTYFPELGIYSSLDNNRTEDEKSRGWLLSIVSICQDLSKMHISVQNKPIF